MKPKIKITPTIKPESYYQINKIVIIEKRSFSQVTDMLISEALEARKKKNK